MDRNSVIGLLLIGAVILLFSILNKPSEEEKQKLQRVRDSIAQLKKETEQQLIQQPETNKEFTEPKSKEQDSVKIKNKIDALGDFGQHIFGEDEFYILENDLLKFTISRKGGRPYSVLLKKYKTHDSLPLILFNGDSTIFNIQFPTQQNRIINTQDLYFDLVGDSKHLKAEKTDAQIILRIGLDENKYMDYIYSLSPDNYMVDFDIRMKGMDDILGYNLSALDLTWEIYAPQQEKGKTNENNYSSIFYKHYQDDVNNLPLRSKKEEASETIKTSLKWIAFKDQFFSSVIIAEDKFSYATVRSTKLPEEDKFLKIFRTEVEIPYEGGNSVMDIKFYFGPNSFKTLKAYGDLELHHLVSLGRNIIRFINRYVIIELFNFLQKYISNYGIIILILTLVIKMILLPLTYKSYISQAKMRVLKPQIDEINAKIPKEKAMERQKATMELYKKVGINPMGGCLPMILQMPILFAMFRFFPTSIELRQQGFLWAHDLSTYDAIIEWSGEIPILSTIYGNHISLFTLLMTISTLLTMKLNSQATTGSTQMPGMKGMMYIMPIMFMFVLNNFSAGLTYYYFLANIITFGQNFLFKRFVDEEEILKKLHAKKAKPTKKSGFQARLEKMAKERGYNLPKK